jgi:O-antigen ligase
MATIETRTGFNHNGYLYLYLKMGAIGLVVYLMLLKKAFAHLWRLCVRQRQGRDLTMHVGFLGALVCLCVLSFAVNKIFAVSGAMFSGLALGFCDRTGRQRVAAGRANLLGVRAFGAALARGAPGYSQGYAGPWQ